MSIPSATRPPTRCTQHIAAQPSLSTMPTYLPITPYPAASTPPLSITELTDRIDTCVHTYLSPTALTSLLSTTPQNTHPTTHHSEASRLNLNRQNLNLQKLATAYSETCSLIWQQALTPTPLTPNSPTIPLTLTHSLHTLSHRWATGKHHHPNAPFFTNAITLGSLQSKWHYPEIQTSLRQTTASLRQVSPYSEWLMAYPTGWSYAVGRTMQQLLQWNYRLTPATLREFLILD